MIHLAGLPHTSLDDRKYSSCAFTAKAVRLIEMLEAVGEDVNPLWGDGAWDPSTLPNIEWDPRVSYWAEFNQWCIDSIRETISPDDIIMIMAGSTQQCVVDAFPNHRTLEPCVGYEGIARDTFACFESYAWMHNRYGAFGIGDGRAFDAVIPNFQRAEDFELGEDEGYLLFLGRHIARKGVRAASDIAKRAGVRLLTAGSGGTQMGDDIVCEDGTVVPDATYLGSLGPTDRKDVLSHASALVVPTLYIEPFGTVQIEAWMSGVPVVAPDYGVFTETVLNDINGYRYRTLNQAADGVEAATHLRGPFLQELALSKYSMSVCAAQYAEWLERIRSLDDRGWYS